jgi:hypothetical protein
MESPNPSHEQNERTSLPVDGTRDSFTLVKGPHRWEFSCEPGEEPALLNRLAELAADPDSPFDVIDAALVGHRVSEALRRDGARGVARRTRGRRAATSASLSLPNPGGHAARSPA